MADKQIMKMYDKSYVRNVAALSLNLTLVRDGKFVDLNLLS